MPDTDIPSGFWQCTAFDGDDNAYSDFGPTRDEAAYNALYRCADGVDFEDKGCFVPDDYCQMHD